MNNNIKHNNKFFELYKLYFKKEVLNFIILCTFIILGVASQSITPYIYGNIIDYVAKGNFDKLKTILITYFIILTVISILSVIEIHYGTMLSTKICNNIKVRIFNKIISMKNKNLTNYTIGELINHLEIDASIIVNFYVDILTSCFIVIINLSVSIYVIFKISFTLAIIATIFIPISYLINVLFKKKYNELQVINRNFNDKYSGFTNETINNIREIKIFQLENKKYNQYFSLLKESLSIILKQVHIINMISFLKNLITNLFMFSAKQKCNIVQSKSVTPNLFVRRIVFAI
jgi:ABC-type multidrug transport system fused ATPase/permease subunit